MNAAGERRTGKREAVREMFTSIAPAYDRLNHILSGRQDLRWRKASVRLFSPSVHRVLDVAAGTGDLALALLDERPDTEAVASDFVVPMCMAARDKLAGRAGFSGSIVADALHLPMPENCFDAAMVAFGVRNFENLQEGLSELARVIKPGGEVMILEFFPARGPLAQILFRIYFNHLLPLIGGLLSGNREAYRYLPRSVGDFATRDQFRQLLADTGFRDIRSREFSGGIATAFHAISG